MEDTYIADEYYQEKEKEERSVGWWWPLIICLAGSLLYYLIYLNDDLLPKFVSIENLEQHPEKFCGECSREISRRFTNLGPRIVGTTVNEIETPKILLEELNKIKLKASPNQIINITEQKGSGGYPLEYNPPFINIYDDIKNVIVMLKGSEGRHSVLVNCHYDTVENSPGASDDMISCAAMIDVLRLHSRIPVKPKHNLIFLFNGAEETYFQGSHLFLQHEWAQTCKVVINLEACGVGGRNILFQSGPNHPWLFKYYAKSAVRPHGQIFGEELFQSGAIPSDSDFRIFRDFGNMPGLDFAFWRNGYLYHTPKDSEGILPIGSHQYLGDNLHKLLLRLAEAPELNNLKDNAEGQMVYFDYLGWFMIYYSNTTSIILNSLAVVLGFASIVLFIIRTIVSLHSGQLRSIIVEFLFVTYAIIIAMGAAIAIPVMISLFVDTVGKYAMPWYDNPMLIVPFYWFPSVAVYMLIPCLMSIWRSKKHEMSITTICQMYLIASQIPWLITMIILLGIGSRSSAILFLYIMSSAIANIIIHATPMFRKAYAWIWLYLMVHLPALAYNMYVVVMAYMFFIPIFGRSGIANNDLSISILTAICIYYLMSFVLPLIVIVKRPGIMMILLLIVSLMVLICTLSTNLGYPYSLSKPQRHFLMHTNRQFRNEKFIIRREDNGLFIHNYDKNSLCTLPIVKESLVSLNDDCQNELLCGVPLYGSRMIQMSRNNHWFPMGQPNLPIETELQLNDSGRNCNSTELTCEFTFILRGPNRLTLTFATRSGAYLSNWSLPSKILATSEWNGQPVFMIHIVRTSTIDKEITLKFNVSSLQINGAPIVDIGLAGNFVHHDNYRTEAFNSILINIGPESSVEAWISAYRGYVF